MKDSMYYFLLGFATMGLVAMFIASKYPTPDGEFACSKCNISMWYFRPAGGEQYAGE